MKQVILYFILFSAIVSAGAQVTLNRQQCREMALDYSKTIQLSQNQYNQAKLVQKIAKSGFFPKIEASGSYFYKPDALEYSLDGGYLPTYLPDSNGDGIPDPNIATNVDGTPIIGVDNNPIFNMYAFLPDININLDMKGISMAGIELQQPIYAGGKIRAANRMAKTGIKIADLQIEKNRAEVLAQTDQAFFQLVSIKAKKKSAIRYKILLDSLVSDLQDAMDEGMATKNDLLKVLVKRNEAILMVQKAQNGETLAKMNLCRIIGLPLKADIAIPRIQTDSLSNLFLPDKENFDPHERPELKMLHKTIEVKEFEAKMARAGMLPQLGISAGYHYFSGLEFNGQATDEMSFIALASVKIPVFKWFEERNKLSKAKLEQKAVQLQLEEVEKLLQLEIAQAKFNLEDAIKRWELTSSALKQATENWETSHQQFEAGLEPLVNLLEAQAQWQQAQSDHIDAQTAVKLMETEYLKAVGKLN
ncbi:TolC family protein [Thermophagus sp. OGC60D27]|uniref:TolC family protein n=1 Tax=Thermophagus sp. OGC60D27 TaxID=3458415 RepID=UPI004037DB16